jgi:hypothetical protein
MLKNLAKLSKLANRLDEIKRIKEADYLDRVIEKMAQDWDGEFESTYGPHDDDDEDGEEVEEWDGDPTDPENMSFEDQYQAAWEEEAQEDLPFQRMTGVKPHTFRSMMTLMYQLANGEVISIQAAQENAQRILAEEGLKYEDINPAPERAPEPEEELPENVTRLFPKGV